MIRLYDNGFSPFARKVRLVLEHKGLAYEAFDGLLRFFDFGLSAVDLPCRHGRLDRLTQLRFIRGIPARLDGGVRRRQRRGLGIFVRLFGGNVLISELVVDGASIAGRGQAVRIGVHEQRLGLEVVGVSVGR